MARILFVDTHDASRGPMAEALARAYGLEAESVGTLPALAVTSAAEAAMARAGLHVRSHRPHWVDLHHLHGGFDRIIALGDDVLPSSPDLHVHETWHVPEPSADSLAEHERIRAVLNRGVRDLFAEFKGWT